MKRKIPGIKWSLMLLILMIFAVSASVSHAVRIRISQSNSNGFSYDSGSTSFVTNSPVWIPDIMEDATNGGYANGPFESSTGLHEVVFEDSATYDLHADLVAARSAGKLDLTFSYDAVLDYGGMSCDGAIILGSLSPNAVNHPDGFSESGAVGFYIHAADGQMPTLDLSNFSEAGGDTFMSSTNPNTACVFMFCSVRPGIENIIQGIRFYNNTLFSGYTSGVEWAMTKLIGAYDNASMPHFEDCIFDLRGLPTFWMGRLQAGGAGDFSADTAEFTHCAWRLDSTGDASARHIACHRFSHLSSGWTGTVDFLHCTFLMPNAVGAAWPENHWVLEAGHDANQPRCTLNYCLIGGDPGSSFNGWSEGGSYVQQTAGSFTHNNIFPFSDQDGPYWYSGYPDNTAGSQNVNLDPSNINQDPLLIDLTAATNDPNFAIYQATSPCVVDGTNNIGYDIWTGGSGTPTPTATVTVTPSPTPGDGKVNSTGLSWFLYQ